MHIVTVPVMVLPGGTLVLATYYYVIQVNRGMKMKKPGSSAVFPKVFFYILLKRT